MSNNKQSSIEFLWDELKPLLPENYTVDESVKILSILKQARAMHREEINDAYWLGYGDHQTLDIHNLDEVFDYIFGGNNEQQ